MFFKMSFWKLSVLFLIIIFFAFESVNSNNPTYSEIDEDAYLIQYGKYVFERENCKQCHTLQISEDRNKISLDGLSERFSYEWHFIHLVEPSIMDYYSEMPSFSFLKEQQIEYKKIKEITNLKKKYWNLILRKIDSLDSNLGLYLENEFGNDDRFKFSNRSEIVPLIKYLQSIPTSNELRIKDSLFHEETEKERIYLGSLLSNEESIIYHDILNKKTIEAGEIVYNNNCIPCHGFSGRGGIGPNLTDNYSIYGSELKDIAKVIVMGGKPGKGMIPWSSTLTPSEVNSVLAYIVSLEGTNPKDAKAPEGIKRK